MGKTGIRISELGFGAWGIGGNHGKVSAYGSTNDNSSIRAIQRSRKLGVTLFDTADLYGDGHSERIIGKALHAEREHCIIATKGGFINATGGQDFGKRHLSKALENSLERLNTDYVDIYQMHSPIHLNSRFFETVADWASKKKKEGLLRAFGISVLNPEDAFLIPPWAGVDTVQANFSFADQRVLELGLFERFRELGIGFLGRSALAKGFLCSKMDIRAQSGESDHRNNLTGKTLARLRAARKAFQKHCTAKKSANMTKEAISFCLSENAVSSVILGVLTAKQATENFS